MFDRKKLEAFLDALEVETHFPSKIPAAPRSELDRKMDKYDIFNDREYTNVSTPEFPVLARQQYQFGFNGFMPMPTIPGGVYATYGMINRVMGFVSGVDAASAPTQAIPTPYDKLKGKIRKLKTAPAAKIPDPTPPAPQKSPDYVHTLTAWRGWDIENGLLSGLGTDYEWEPKRAVKARCQNDHHPAPQSGCHCGFWSFKTFDGIVSAMSGYVSSVEVIGTVEIWGRVIECENGFRSEYAYPKELWLLSEGLEHLSWDYGVPVRRL